MDGCFCNLVLKSAPFPTLRCDPRNVIFSTPLASFLMENFRIFITC